MEERYWCFRQEGRDIGERSSRRGETRKGRKDYNTVETEGKEIAKRIDGIRGK